MVNYVKVLRNKGEELLFYGLGRGCCKQRVHWRKLRVQSVVTFHWPSYGGPPLAELLLGQEESLLLLLRQ